MATTTPPPKNSDWSPGLLPYANDIALRLECIKQAQYLNPEHAGELIRKAAGIYSWITEGTTTNGT